MVLDGHTQSPNERFHRQLLFKIEINYAENGKVSEIRGLLSFFKNFKSLIRCDQTNTTRQSSEKTREDLFHIHNRLKRHYKLYYVNK